MTSPTPTVTPPVQIPSFLTEVATNADELKRQLQEVKRRLADDAERVSIQRTLEDLTGGLDARAQQTDEVIRSLPALPELQDLDSEWAGLSRRLDEAQRALAANAAVLSEDIKWLNDQEQKWTATLSQLEGDPSLLELHSTVSQSLDEIRTTRALAEEQLRSIVTLQTRTSGRDHFINGIREKIDGEKAEIQRRLLQADSSPLWDFAARHRTDPGLQRVLHRDYRRDWLRLRGFISAERSAMQVAVLIFLLMLAAGFKMRRQLPAWVDAGIVELRLVYIFKRPFSVAVFAGLLATLPLLPTAPAAARGVLGLILIIPVVRLIGPLIRPVDRLLLYTLVASTLLIQLIKVTTASISWKRDVLALLSLAIGLATVWLSRRMNAPENEKGVGRTTAVFAVRIGALLMFGSFAANLFGYFALSQVFTDTVLVGAYYAVVLQTARKVIIIILATLLKTKKARFFTVLAKHHARIVTWCAVTLALAFLTFWILSILNLLTVRDDFFDAAKAALTRPLGSGEGSFTSADVISFGLVLVLGIIFATVLRAVLREDVLRRLPVHQGVPFALSTIIYYVLLLFVFLLALVSAGVQLSKFTLFTGAFGIGVGFGLQNTINNFAAGLVLLLERPIRENDILEVEGAFGEVTRIGMRSTSIRTSEEAEVIVPNSTLVTGKVINWSRLGRRRPVEIPVRVAYGTDPQMIIELLVKTAATHSDVLREPPAAAFLQKFGEKALEFVLVFWVSRYYLHRKVLSEVAIRITEAFKEAGIQIFAPEQGSSAEPGPSTEAGPSPAVNL